MIRRALSAITLLLGLSSPAFAFQECKFSFEIDTQSSAFQARIRDAQETGGLWRPIREAPDDVRAISLYIGRLDICLVTPDGKPREISVNGQTATLQSPHVTSCTAALLPNNRLLTNHHCFYEDTLAAAGFNIVQEARINFDYVAKDFTDNVKTFLVLNREVAMDEKLDAMVLQIIGGDANEALGGHIPLVMETRATPRRKMTMVHHPRGLPQQYSDYTCQIHPDQNMLPEAASQLRHRCESAGGSSGSLLLDARSLAVVGLHNQGGMGPQGGYNGGHKIEMINAALGLGFKPVTAPAPDALQDPLANAKAALVAAMLEQDPSARITALEHVAQRYANTKVADSAQNILASLSPPEIPQKETSEYWIRVSVASTLEGSRYSADRHKNLGKIVVFEQRDGFFRVAMGPFSTEQKAQDKLAPFVAERVLSSTAMVFERPIEGSRMRLVYNAN